VKFLLPLFFPAFILAHPGRTDSKGGVSLILKNELNYQYWVRFKNVKRV